MSATHRQLSGVCTTVLRAASRMPDGAAEFVVSAGLGWWLFGRGDAVVIHEIGQRPLKCPRKVIARVLRRRAATEATGG